MKKGSVPNWQEGIHCSAMDNCGLGFMWTETPARLLTAVTDRAEDHSHTRANAAVSQKLCNSTCNLGKIPRLMSSSHRTSCVATWPCHLYPAGNTSVLTASPFFGVKQLDPLSLPRGEFFVEGGGGQIFACWRNKAFLARDNPPDDGMHESL